MTGVDRYEGPHTPPPATMLALRFQFEFADVWSLSKFKIAQ